MTNFENAIEKLLRRIKRAAEKNKWGKVNRLTNELNDLYELQEQAEQHQEEQEQQQSNSGSNSGSVGGSNDEDGPLADALEREDIDINEQREEEEE
tara:strand:+ start:150 stop:437 length:288 start_codon:yes stop_codon:yes gene_type:complete